MMRKNIICSKLKTVGVGVVLWVILCSNVVVTSGFNFDGHNSQFQRRSLGQAANSASANKDQPHFTPIQKRQYIIGYPQMQSHHPHRPYYGHGGGGGRIVEAVKASIHPLHLHGDSQGSYSYNSPPIHYPTSNSAQYSGFFYSQDKHRKPPQQQVQGPFYSNAYFPQDSLWTPVARPPGYQHHGHDHGHGRPSPIVPQRYPHRHFPVHTAPVVTPSGQVASGSASMETYQEALNLFSEVVKKLEKEPGNTYGIQHMPSSHSHVHHAPVSNGIYGSSLPLAPPPGGFPHHLDHIMGPEFLDRAQKLYTKIIKEQNHRLSKQHPHHHPLHPSHPPYHNHHHHHPNPHHNPMSSPPMYHGSRLPQEAPAYGGLSYLEGVMNGNGQNYEGRPGPPRPHSHQSLHTYARSMTVEPGSSLVDAVKALEVSVPSRYAHSEVGSAEELMMTSESNMSPQQSSPHVHSNSNSNQLHSDDSPAQFSHPSSSSSPPEMALNFPPQLYDSDSDSDSDSDAAASSSSPSTFPRSSNVIIPLNENDYVEHPLPYDEYEGLIKEIAINHNY